MGCHGSYAVEIDITNIEDLHCYCTGDGNNCLGFCIFHDTLQLVAFANSRTEHIIFLEETRTVLRHVLLYPNWTDSRDVFVYPPGNGPNAVYTRGGLADSLGSIVEKVCVCVCCDNKL
jgi:hypothetical protein